VTIGLVTHVPVASNTLPDWELSVEPASEPVSEPASEPPRGEGITQDLELNGGEDDDVIVMETTESQDFNVFSLRARKRRGKL